MKWIIPLLVVVCVTSAVPKKERAFSLFSVVSFPNDECTTTTDATMKGICRTAEECGESGGTESGNCASGFGVCCYHTISAAGAISNNLTYIQNTGYPTTTGTTADTATKSFAYTVTGSNLCQVRLDFDDVELIQPTTAAGVCTATTADQLRAVGGTGNVVQTGLQGDLCGTLTGSHMYVHNDGSSTAATITITIGSTVVARKWKIKVTTIECDNLARAPAGCLQYHTGATGSITSFNGGSTTVQMIEKQEYSVCIRAEAGMCSFSVAQDTSALNTKFDMTDAGTATAIVGNGCVAEQSWLVIPNSGVVEPKYCGGALNPVTANTVASPVISNVKPFTIGVVSVATLLNTNGFEVNYAQIPCAN